MTRAFLAKIKNKKFPIIVEKDTDRDFYLSAEEAKKYGLIDEVIGATK